VFRAHFLCSYLSPPKIRAGKNKI